MKRIEDIYVAKCFYLFGEKTDIFEPTINRIWDRLTHEFSQVEINTSMMLTQIGKVPRDETS